MVGMKACLTKQHCHCHNVHLIPDDHEPNFDNREPAPPLELSNEMFHIGETLLYLNAGHTAYVQVEKIYLDDNAVLRIWVQTTNDELIKTTKELL